MGLLKTVKDFIYSTQPDTAPKIVEDKYKKLVDDPVVVPINQPKIIHGSVSIRENEIHVQDPNEYGSFATIHIPGVEHMSVLINGERKVGHTIISEMYTIQVEFSLKEPTVRLEEAVSDDRLSVTLKVIREPGIQYRLKDVYSTIKANFEIEEELIAPLPIKLEDLLARLQASGYRGQYDYSALQEICMSNESIERIVISGKQPKPGRAAQYIKVPHEKEYDPLRKRMTTSTIKMGATVAVYEQEIPGVPGEDVYGKIISALVPKELPTLGSGVIEVNGRVVATRNGRLIFKKSMIDVVPELVIDHPLDPKDGSILFDGDVKIFGDVHDGSFIRATGMVSILGNVFGSTIYGEKGIYIRGNVTNVKLYSGYGKILYKKIDQVVDHCLTELLAFYRDYQQMVELALRKIQTQNKIVMIPALLLEKRYQTLSTNLQLLCTDFEQQLVQIDSKYEVLNQLIRYKWQGIQTTTLKDQDIQHLIKLMQEFKTHVQLSTSAKPAPVQIANVTSSSIHASGNITIKGTGTFSSMIESEHSILVHGIVRGGFLSANRSIFIHELGSPAGVECSVKIKDQNGTIHIKNRHPNTVLDIVGKRNRSYWFEQNVTFRGDSN